MVISRSTDSRGSRIAVQESARSEPGNGAANWRQSKWLAVGELVVVGLIFWADFRHLIFFSKTPYLVLFGWISLWVRKLRWRDVGKLDCTIARTLAVIGDRWTLLVLRDAFLGTRRFAAFQKSLGVTRHRLADRLAKLVKHGVLRRERYQDHPPRFEYRLTDKGRKQLVVEESQWKQMAEAVARVMWPAAEEN